MNLKSFSILFKRCLWIFFPVLTMAQQFEVLPQNKCYEKYDQRAASGFVINDCDQLKGVVDCNDKLDYNAEMDRVFSRNTGDAFTGKCQTCYYSGIRERLINFVNGKEHGVDTTYYETGCIKVVRNHNQGKETGVWTFFHDSTALEAWRMGFINGEKHGEHIYFSKKGDTLSQEFFKNGKLNGPRKVYFPKSELKEIANYNEGLLEGDNISYFQGGQVSKHLRFKLGQKQGKQEYFYANGQVMRVELYDKNLKNGEFNAYFIDGKIQALENWIRGMRHGYFRQYYTNGRLQSEILYDQDKVIVSRKYDEYGTLVEGVDPVNGEDDLIPDLSGKKKRSKAKKDKKKQDKLKKKEAEKSGTSIKTD